MGRLKEAVGEVVIERLKPVREDFERLQREEGYLREVAEKGRRRAGETARKTMEEVRRSVGLSQI